MEQLINAEVVHLEIGSTDERRPLFIIWSLILQGSIHGPVVIQSVKMSSVLAALK